MPLYRIHRMKEQERQRFRWAPHVSGVAHLRPKDYELAGDIEAGNVYAAWSALRDSERPLRVGDVLEIEGGPPRIYKYVGFEEACWEIPPPAPSYSDSPSPSQMDGAHGS